jgi:hypothetical protein
VKEVSKLDAESCVYVCMAMLSLSKNEVVCLDYDVVPQKSFKASLCNPKVSFGRARLITR